LSKHILDVLNVCWEPDVVAAEAAAAREDRETGAGSSANAPRLDWDVVLRGPPNRQSLLQLGLIDMMTGFGWIDWGT